jgi:hypothetical protein
VNPSRPALATILVLASSHPPRCLAAFETDVKRRRLMHNQRTVRLQPLHGALNVEFFLGLVRSISLELGNISREVMELEEEEGRPANKVRVEGEEALGGRGKAVLVEVCMLPPFPLGCCSSRAISIPCRLPLPAVTQCATTATLSTPSGTLTAPKASCPTASRTRPTNATSCWPRSAWGASCPEAWQQTSEWVGGEMRV